MSDASKTAGFVDRWLVRLLWSALVLAVFPGSCILMANNTDHDEQVYAQGCCDYPVPIDAFGYGMIQGAGFGFGEAIWTLMKKLETNDSTKIVRDQIRYKMGGASKEHPKAYLFGVVSGSVLAAFFLVGAIAKVREG
jgi:hypothetical protein